MPSEIELTTYTTNKNIEPKIEEHSILKEDEQNTLSEKAYSYRLSLYGGISCFSLFLWALIGACPNQGNSRFFNGLGIGLAMINISLYLIISFHLIRQTNWKKPNDRVGKISAGMTIIGLWFGCIIGSGIMSICLLPYTFKSTKLYRLTHIPDYLSAIFFIAGPFFTFFPPIIHILKAKEDKNQVAIKKQVHGYYWECLGTMLQAIGSIVFLNQGLESDNLHHMKIHAFGNISLLSLAVIGVAVMIYRNHDEATHEAVNYLPGLSFS